MLFQIRLGKKMSSAIVTLGK